MEFDSKHRLYFVLNPGVNVQNSQIYKVINTSTSPSVEWGYYSISNETYPFGLTFGEDENWLKYYDESGHNLRISKINVANSSDIFVQHSLQASGFFGNFNNQIRFLKNKEIGITFAASTTIKAYVDNNNLSTINRVRLWRVIENLLSQTIESYSISTFEINFNTVDSSNEIRGINPID